VSASPGRATATAPANIAFVKYWGARDLARALPLNPSISMTLRRCVTRTTVEVLPGPGDDEVWWLDEGVPRGAGREAARDPGAAFTARVRAHLAHLRRRAGLGPGEARFRVLTGNTFPAAAGMASSASGFAALTVAGAAALGLALDPGELSSLARQSGSGSAARSVLGGYVEWPDPAGGDPDDPRAVQLAPAAHWDLRDVVAVVESGAKEVSSLDGHRRAASSPYLGRRLELLPDRLERVRRGLAGRDLDLLGATVEEEALDLHLIAMSSRPPIHYWSPGTVEVLAAVRALRRDGVEAWSTMDAGPNVHVLCTPEAEEAVAARLGAIPSVGLVLRDGVGPGPTVEAVA
jgi:diphosphomevalonate decarboxylase